MNQSIPLFFVVTICLIFGAWVARAPAQVSTDPGIGAKIEPTSPRTRIPVSVDGIPAQFDLETRVEVLERQVVELREQVGWLAAKVGVDGTSVVGPSGRLTPLSPADEGSGSTYSGPQLKVSAPDKKE